MALARAWSAQDQDGALRSLGSSPLTRVQRYDGWATGLHVGDLLGSDSARAHDAPFTHRLR